MSEHLGRKAYAAYLKAVGNRTWDGKTPPVWEALGDRIREGWIAAGITGAEIAREALLERIVFCPERETCGECRAIPGEDRCAVCQAELDAAGRARAVEWEEIGGNDAGE